jgi:protein-disulfide isomerase
MREIWFSLLLLLPLTAFAPALAQSPAPAPSANLTAPPSTAANRAKLLALGPKDLVLGKPDAPITIVEYASLTCPHCAHFEADVLPELKKKWIDTGKVKLVMRDYPLDEPALRAAIIARCAPPDQFYGFVEMLFAQQQQWVLAKDYKEALTRLAALGGMSKAKFDSCLADKSVENRVLDSRLVASQDLGVESTPSFFINGTQFSGAPTVEEFDTFLSRLAGS